MYALYEAQKKFKYYLIPPSFNTLKGRECIFRLLCESHKDAIVLK